MLLHSNPVLLIGGISMSKLDSQFLSFIVLFLLLLNMSCCPISLILFSMPNDFIHIPHSIIPDNYARD